MPHLKRIREKSISIVFGTSVFLCVAHLICQSLPAAQATATNAMVLRGSLDCTTYSADHRPKAREFIRFEAYLSDCRWLIRTIPGSLDKEESLESKKSEIALAYKSTVSFDGVNLYQLTSVSSNSAPPLPKMRQTDLRVLTTGTVLNRQIPPLDFTYSLPIWLALASKCFFLTNTNTIPLMFSEFPTTRTNREYYSVGAARTNDGNSQFISELTLSNRRYPLPKGPVDLGAEFGELVDYRVIEWSDTSQEFVYPKLFRLSVFRPYLPSYPEGTPRRILWFMFNGKIDKADMTADEITFKPNISEPTHVLRDERLIARISNSVSYFAASNWADLNTKEIGVKIASLSSSQKSIAPPPKRKPESTKKLFFLGLATVNIILLIWIIRFVAKKKNST